jgi:hypothetical protein
VSWFNVVLKGEGGAADSWTLGRVALLEKLDGALRAKAVGDTLVRCLKRRVLGKTQVSVGYRWR